jgi:hypothetical protein
MTQPSTQLNISISWLSIVNYLGALLTAGWTLYLIYTSAGITYAALALLVLGVLLKFGASPLFALCAGVLYFHFDAAGLWLPLGSWLLAGLAFRSDLKRYRASA